MRYVAQARGAAMALLVAAILAWLPAHDADAGNAFSHRLNGGVFGRPYTVDSGANPSWYTAAVDQSVGYWNATGKVSFYKTTNYNISAIDFYAYNFGFTQWRGLTGLYAGSGTSVWNGYDTTQNWDWAECYLNHAYLDEDNTYYHNILRTDSTAGHEMGHAIGIAHTSSPYQLMHPSITRFDTYWVYAPQQDDINVTDFLY